MGSGTAELQALAEFCGVAVLAVHCKPVSVFDFPVLSEFAGNFAFSAQVPDSVAMISLQKQLLAGELAAHLMSEIPAVCRI